MNALLLEILSSNSVRDENGNVLPLHSNISTEEVNFISEMIGSNKLTKAVEIGCAMGISSIAIAEAIAGNGGSGHYIIDPNQKSQWDNIGIQNLKRAGFRNFELVEDYSEFALPALVKLGVKVNFGFIDGWHTFDHTLIDFFYINRMLEVNGVVIIDDVHMPAVSKAVRYIYNYPGYEYVGKVRNTELTAKRKFYEKAVNLFTFPRHLMGDKVSKEIFNSKVLRTDKELNLDCTMIAFKKVAEDQRPWNWYENF